MKNTDAAAPKYWYEWGNEPFGFVSTGYYDTNQIWRSLGYMKKEDATTTLTFHNPYP